jgi:hypothetical protein
MKLRKNKFVCHTQQHQGTVFSRMKFYTCVIPGVTDNSVLPMIVISVVNIDFSFRFAFVHNDNGVSVFCIFSDIVRLFFLDI